MKNLVRKLNDNIIQITTLDERWYIKSVDGVDKFVPSVTWIAECYPKGIAFYKWLADKGWKEAEALKNAAGDKGSKVHFAIDDLLNGKEVKMDDKYINRTIEEEEELTLGEWECLMGFCNWRGSVELKPIATEITIFSDQYGYGGTIDFIGILNGFLWILDWKSGQYIWPSSELQLSGYKQGVFENKDLMKKIKELGFSIDDAKLGILQVGYNRNKKGFKFTEVEDKFDLFLSAKKIWENENKNVEPKQKDYPTSLSLNN